MANFFVTHHRFPENPQLFTINITKVVKKGGEDNPSFKPSYPSAESYWEILIYTTGTDSAGAVVGPIVTDVIGSESGLTALINERVADLCSLIDWSQQGDFIESLDTEAPIVAEQLPQAGQQDVSINSPIVIRVQDRVPAVGIDVSTVVMKVNGLYVNPQTVGNKYDTAFIFKPRPVQDS